MLIDDKVLENRVRRTLLRRGYRLEKSKRRDPLALDYGKYWVWSLYNSLVSIPSGKTFASATGPETAQLLLARLGLGSEGCASLKEIADWLDSMGEGQQAAN